MLWKIRKDTAVGMWTQMEPGLSSLACSAGRSECVQSVTGKNTGDWGNKEKTGVLRRLD